MPPITTSMACAVVVSFLAIPGSAAKHKPAQPSEAELESAVAESPTVDGPWLELARFHAARGQKVPAVLAYGRFVTPNANPASAKDAATRVWIAESGPRLLRAPSHPVRRVGRLQCCRLNGVG
jgi:hypothetical protein